MPSDPPKLCKDPVATCTNPQCKKQGNAKQMLECSQCAGVGEVTAYCDVSCQRAHWTEHKPTCTQAKELLDKLSSDVRPYHRLLNRWWRRQSGSSTLLAASAINVVNFPENARRYDTNVFVEFKDASTVEVVDVLIGDATSYSPEEANRVNKCWQMISSESPSGVAIMPTLRPPSKISDRVLSVNDTLLRKLLCVTVTRRRLPTITAQTLHTYHVAGLPCVDWKQRYMEKVNRGEILGDKDFIVVSGPSIDETPARREEALREFAASQHINLKIAFVQRMLASQLSTEDNALVIYVGNVSDSDLKYKAQSVGFYSPKDAQSICPEAILDIVTSETAQFANNSDIHIPLVLLCTIGKASYLRIPMTIDDEQLAIVASCDPEGISAARDESAWRASLLSQLGGRKLVNEAEQEVEARKSAC